MSNASKSMAMNRKRSSKGPSAQDKTLAKEETSSKMEDVENVDSELQEIKTLSSMKVVKNQKYEDCKFKNKERSKVKEECSKGRKQPS